MLIAGKNSKRKGSGHEQNRNKDMSALRKPDRQWREVLREMRRADVSMEPAGTAASVEPAASEEKRSPAGSEDPCARPSPSADLWGCFPSVQQSAEGPDKEIHGSGAEIPLRDEL